MAMLIALLCFNVLSNNFFSPLPALVLCCPSMLRTFHVFRRGSQLGGLLGFLSAPGGGAGRWRRLEKPENKAKQKP